MKEPNYFNTDMRLAGPRMSAARYGELFASAAHQKRIGEASVWYLYSKNAAQEILKYNPLARIIILLRNPADMLYSLYQELFIGADENLADFTNALEAESERKKHRTKHGGYLPVECLFYREIGAYSEQVRRYVDAFGRDRIHVILFDDLKDNPAGVYREVLKFLDVPEQQLPEFKIINPSKMVRSMAVHRLLYYSPQGVRRMVRALLPETTRWKIRMFIRSLNLRQEKPRPLNPALRMQLLREFASDLQALSGIIGRDLSHWSR